MPTVGCGKIITGVLYIWTGRYLRRSEQDYPGAKCGEIGPGGNVALCLRCVKSNQRERQHD